LKEVVKKINNISMSPMKYGTSSSMVYALKPSEKKRYVLLIGGSIKRSRKMHRLHIKSAPPVIDSSFTVTDKINITNFGLLAANYGKYSPLEIP
jgi:hypothetical protein